MALQKRGLEEIGKTGQAVIEPPYSRDKGAKAGIDPVRYLEVWKMRADLRGRSLQKNDRLRNRMETGTKKDLKYTHIISS